MLHDHNIDELKHHMELSLGVLEDEFKKVSTGRANPAMVEDLQVDYYGAKTPLKHMANVASPDAGTITIRPFDKSQIEAIEKSIIESNLGFNPATADEMIRITVPRLSDERRKELVKMIHHQGEETKVALRNIRRHLKDEYERLKGTSEMSEDDFHRNMKELDDVTHQFTDRVDKSMNDKEQQLTTV
jgi:ribosome recycling factor